MHSAQPHMTMCTRAHMHVCMNIYACIHVYTCMGKESDMNACVHVCMYACMYVCMYVFMHLCIYIGVHWQLPSDLVLITRGAEQS